jgi:hypothetical protein
VKTAIQTTWLRGIQNEKDISGAYEIQLRGNPWSGQGDEAVPARVLMCVFEHDSIHLRVLTSHYRCEVLSAIYHNGWELRMSTDISQKALDKDLLIFREGPLPPPCQFLAISFNDNDRLRIISGSGGTSTPNVAPNDVINAVKNVWGGNIQKEQWKVQGVAWEFKLAGLVCHLTRRIFIVFFFLTWLAETLGGRRARSLSTYESCCSICSIS